MKNPELKTATQRRAVLKLYGQSPRRGRNLLMDLTHDVVREAKLRKLPPGLARGNRFAVYEGDMAQRAGELHDASADLLVADIVYGDLEMAAKVGRLAQQKLASTGVLAVYSGHLRNVEILNALAEHLDLMATGWHRIPGSMRGAGTFVSRIDGLPVWILCRKGARPSHPVRHLEFTSTNQRAEPKGFHRWQKDLDATLDLVRSIVKPGSLVVDPCCGSGTTGEAALRHGCKFIGIDIDPAAVAVARSRLAEVERSLARRPSGGHEHDLKVGAV